MAANGGLTFTPPRPGKPYAGSGGGVAFNPNWTPPGLAGGLVGPPPFTFDPALEAQRRAAQRGLEDTEADIKKERKWGAKDYRQARRDITTQTKRSRANLTKQRDRDEENLGNRESDLQTDAQRSREDFQTRLNKIGRDFGDLAHRQAEAANASGVLDAGTSAAAAAARARNQAEAEQPIFTAQKRMEEDLVTALGRLATDRTQLGEDFDTDMSRLIQDRNRSRRLTTQEFKRGMFDLKTKLQRARREGAITDIDLLEQQIWQAKESHPGAFKKWAQENGDVMSLIKGTKPQRQNAGLSVGRGMVAPPPKKKGRG